MRSRRSPGPGLFVVLVAAAPLLAGCSDVFGSKDPHDPGAALGTFHVTATQTVNSCGDGALGAGGSWAFDVKLSRGQDALFWDNGAQVIPGALDPDDVSFHFGADIAVDMRTEEAPGPPCSLARHDEAQGVLDSPSSKVGGFDGSLAYSFVPASGSQCDDLVLGGDTAVNPLFAALPCAMSYALSATRTSDP